MSKILLVEDEKVHYEIISKKLHESGNEVSIAKNLARFQEEMAKDWDIILLDRQLGDDDAWSWFAQNQTKFNVKGVFLISAFSGIEQKFQESVYYPVVSKHPPADFLARLQEEIAQFQKRETKQNIPNVRKQATALNQKPLIEFYDSVYCSKPSYMIGIDTKMHKIQEKIERFAPSDIPILVTGPTGTGKELVAEELHKKSGRTGEFKTVNLSALSENLLELELFGSVKGAFTGATETKEGYFEVCDKGTLFLDEIGDIAPLIQVKLLRFLEYKTFQKVGSTKEQKSDVRIVCATNKDLYQEAENGTFRKDLYYRIGCIEIPLPALKKRSEADFDLLMEHFCREYEKNKKLPSGSFVIPEKIYKILKEFEWPGNVREFKHAVQGMLQYADDGKNFIVEEEHIPYYILNPAITPKKRTEILLAKLLESIPLEMRHEELEDIQNELEYLFLNRLYLHYGKNWSKVCKVCDMGETFSKLNKMSKSFRPIYERIAGQENIEEQ